MTCWGLDEGEGPGQSYCLGGGGFQLFLGLDVEVVTDPKEGSVLGVALLIGRTYLYLEEVLGDAVDLLKALGVR